VIVDPTAAARRADPERTREWLAEQRVFISSPMGDTASERQAVAAVVEDEGARPVWFEELGRDADPEEAYLAGVDTATIYVGILNEQYGRLLSTGFSATEAEYLRAREGGKRVAIYTAADAPGREGHLHRFIDRIRTFVTTESYRDVTDLDRRVRRRLHELATEALSPWVKLGDYVFRADLLADHGETVTITARLSDEIAHALETMRDQRWGRPRLKLTYGTRVVEGEIDTVRRTVRAGGGDEIEVELGRAQQPQVDVIRAGTSGLSADELVEAGMRALFLGEPLPPGLGMLDFMTDTGIDRDDLQQAFEQPNEVAQAITRLVVTEGLVGSGRAARISSFSLRPRVGGARRIEIEWIDPRTYTNVEPARRRIEGEWRNG
jgi:Domain of unknown function (DUF4062)